MTRRLNSVHIFQLIMILCCVSHRLTSAPNRSQLILTVLNIEFALHVIPIYLLLYKWDSITGNRDFTYSDGLPMSACESM